MPNINNTIFQQELVVLVKEAISLSDDMVSKVEGFSIQTLASMLHHEAVHRTLQADGKYPTAVREK